MTIMTIISAITLLQSRFGRKDLVISAHMSKLLNLTAVKKSSDVNALRQLYDECEIQIRSLESLGVVSETYGSLLCPILLQMIPDDIALEYSRQRGVDDEWKVSEIIGFLQKEVQSRERALQMLKSPNQQKAESRPWKQSCSFNEGKPKRPHVQSAAALHTASQRTRNCLFCDSTDHNSECCPDHNVAERKDKLKKMGRCFVCLGQKHIAKFCKVKDVSCATCGRRHHIAVCTGQKSEAQPPTVSETAVVSSVIPHSVKMKSDGLNTVLLQTAKAWVEGPAGRKIARCLLDGGSQRSFVHETLVRSLRLPAVKQETLTLHTFGSSVPVMTQRNTVNVILEISGTPSRELK